MAKPTGTSPRQSKPRPRAATRATTRAGHTHEDEVDGCDFVFDESDATADADLPAAKGGMEAKRGRRR